MDCFLDCQLDPDTMHVIGQALRETYAVEAEDEMPALLIRLCAELDRAAAAAGVDVRGGENG